MHGGVATKIATQNEILTTMPHNRMTSMEFGRLFACYRPRFEILANRYVRNQTVAEDIVSESFMTLWENREKLPADCNLPAYVLTVVRNRCLDWLRAQSRHAQIEQQAYELRREVIAADIRSLEAFDRARSSRGRSSGSSARRSRECPRSPGRYSKPAVSKISRTRRSPRCTESPSAGSSSN